MTVRSTLQFPPLFQRGVPGRGPASCATTAVCSTFELMVRAHGRSLLFSFLLCSLCCDELSLPRREYLDFPRPREWEAIAGRYRALFAAHAIQPQDVLLRFSNGRPYVGPHLQEYMASLHAECEKRLTKWTLGVQSTLERGGTLPHFSTAVTATPEETDLALESNLSKRVQLQPGGAALGVTEGDQTARNRGTSLCTYCRRALGFDRGFGGKFFVSMHPVPPRRASAR